MVDQHRAAISVEAELGLAVDHGQTDRGAVSADDVGHLLGQSGELVEVGVGHLSDPGCLGAGQKPVGFLVFAGEFDHRAAEPGTTSVAIRRHVRGLQAVCGKPAMHRRFFRQRMAVDHLQRNHAARPGGSLRAVEVDVEQFDANRVGRHLFQEVVAHARCAEQLERSDRHRAGRLAFARDPIRQYPEVIDGISIGEREDGLARSAVPRLADDLEILGGPAFHGSSVVHADSRVAFAKVSTVGYCLTRRWLPHRHRVSGGPSDA